MMQRSGDGLKTLSVCPQMIDMMTVDWQADAPVPF